MASKPLIVTYGPSYVKANVAAQVTIKGQGFLELLAGNRPDHILMWSAAFSNDKPSEYLNHHSLVVVDNYTIITSAYLSDDNLYVGRIGYYNTTDNTWENVFVNDTKPLP